jgi:hypothetical protein
MERLMANPMPLPCVTITLRLAGRELRTGDKVTVFWDGLLNDAGHLVSGHVGPLIVRSLQ